MAYFDYVADGVASDIQQASSLLQGLQDSMTQLTNSVNPIEQGAWVGKGRDSFDQDWSSLLVKVNAAETWLSDFIKALNQAAEIAETAFADCQKTAGIVLDS